GGVHLPLFQRNIRCREGGRTSSAVKGSLRQRLTALRLARLRRSRLRFAGHLAAPRPLHAALPCGGGCPQSSLVPAPPAVKGAYFSLSTVTLNEALLFERFHPLGYSGGRGRGACAAMLSASSSHPCAAVRQTAVYTPG